MTDNEPEREREPGIEFDYQVDDEGVHTAVVIRDPNRIRRIVMAQFQWIPSVMEGKGSEYPGMDALAALEAKGDTVDLPVLVIGHMPSHLPPEEATEDIQHILYLVEPENITMMIGSGINMFAQDPDKTADIMHLIYHLMGGDHSEEEDPDCDQG